MSDLCFTNYQRIFTMNYGAGGFALTFHSPEVTTGCGRKNSPIWEGHSFRWGARRVVESASSNSGVRAVFSVHHGVVGRTSRLYC
jgi:hypothetical protein